METETQRVLGAPPRMAILTDAEGRVIEVRQLTQRETMRFMRQWGTASNVESWLGIALLSAMAYSIDGVPVPPPRTADMVEALSEQLKESGVKAIAEWVQTLDAEAQMQADRAVAKN